MCECTSGKAEEKRFSAAVFLLLSNSFFMEQKIYNFEAVKKSFKLNNSLRIVDKSLDIPAEFMKKLRLFYREAERRAGGWEIVSHRSSLGQ